MKFETKCAAHNCCFLPHYFIRMVPPTTPEKGREIELLALKMIRGDYKDTK